MQDLSFLTRDGFRNLCIRVLAIGPLGKSQHLHFKQDVQVVHEHLGVWS